MNKKCFKCKGSGVIAKSGAATATKKPYDVVCHDCQGVGHYRVD